MITRYASSLSSAVCVTFGLLFVMQLLIATGRAPIGVGFTPPPPTISARRADTETRIEEIIEPPPPVDPTPPKDTIKPTITDGPAINGKLAVPDTKIVINNGTPGRPNGGIVPIAIMQPDYPRRARIKGLEGYAVVEFTVSAIGNVIDAAIIDSSSRLFEKSALRAIGRFKYKPQIVDGIAIDTQGVRYLFNYTLED
jgi:protein TonB